MTDKQDNTAGAETGAGAGVATGDGTGLGETAAVVAAITTAGGGIERAGDGNANALAAIAGTLIELGQVPAEPYDIAEVAIALMREQAAQIADLSADVASARAAAEKAARAASASAGKAAGKARKISAKDVVDPITGSAEGDAPITREQALLLAIGEAETVEVVLSNGKSELIAVPPIAIHGDAWRISIVGVQLTIPELIVHGPAPGQSAYALNGYGLLLDGVLRAYSARGEQLNIAGGSNNNVAPDIVF